MQEVRKPIGNGIQDDTVALQSMLDSGESTVYLPSGTYLISDTLYIHDNTHLILSHGATIRLADDACCLMLANDKLGKSERNRNIIVEGGTWDGNNPNQRRGKVYENKRYFYGVVMRFEGGEDITVRNITFRNPEAYAVQLLDVDRFTVENITFDYNLLKPNMDGVHVQGPARNGFIRNIKGATNDDLVALNCDDVYDTFDGPCKTQGDIENVTVDGLFADNGYTAVRLLSCGSKMRNINIRNIYGTYRFYGVSFTHHSIFPGAPVWFDSITVDGIYSSKPVKDRNGEPVPPTPHPVIWFAQGVTCGNISLNNIHRIEEAITDAPTVQIDSEVNIQRLVINNITQRFLNSPELPLVVNNGSVKELIQVTKI